MGGERWRGGGSGRIGVVDRRMGGGGIYDIFGEFSFSSNV